MVTGASTADLALVLVDARKGVRRAVAAATPSSPRCCASRTSCCASTRWTSSTTTRSAFEEIKDEFRDFAAKLDITDLTFIPVSALHGDNVVTRSANMPWYEGSSLLHHLEEVHIASDRNLIDARFPVQYVIRPMSDEYHDYRGYAGTVAGGVLKPGDEVVVLPSGFTVDASRRSTPSTARSTRPSPPMSVTVRLDRRDRRQPRRHDLPARTTSPTSARTSTPWSAG